MCITLGILFHCHILNQKSFCCGVFEKNDVLILQSGNHNISVCELCCSSVSKLDLNGAIPCCVKPQQGFYGTCFEGQRIHVRIKNNLEDFFSVYIYVRNNTSSHMLNRTDLIYIYTSLDTQQVCGLITK
mmetsp:Transcript_24276/g.29615  ORF Transcript_24276/g.29615 Transcript_24276/m.29615 type:complete len:129 (-) Transcript_24276:844-1230(-)